MDLFPKGKKWKKKRKNEEPSNLSPELDWDKKSEILRSALSDHTFLPTVIIQIIIIYTKPFLVDTKNFSTVPLPKGKDKWTWGLDIDDQFLYINFQNTFTRASLSSPSFELIPWTPLQLSSGPYGLEIIKELMYVLIKGKVIIFNLEKNETIEEWKTDIETNDFKVDSYRSKNTQIYLSQRHKIIISDLQGKISFTIQGKNKNLKECSALTLSKSDLYISDSSNNSIVILNKMNGDYINTYGKGILKKPTGLYLDIENNLLYISDLAQIIVLESTNGRLIQYIGEGTGVGNGVSTTYSGKNMAVKNGRLYVIEPESQRLLIFG